MPRKQSQKERILQHLKEGNSITGLEALNLFDCFRLADVIFKLKADGHEFKTETVNEDGKSFAKYSFPETTVQSLRENLSKQRTC